MFVWLMDSHARLSLPLLLGMADALKSAFGLVGNLARPVRADEIGHGGGRRVGLASSTHLSAAALSALCLSGARWYDDCVFTGLLQGAVHRLQQVLLLEVHQERKVGECP